jgi:hypothetical protein
MMADGNIHNHRAAILCSVTKVRSPATYLKAPDGTPMANVSLCASWTRSAGLRRQHGRFALNV